MKLCQPLLKAFCLTALCVTQTSGGASAESTQEPEKVRAVSVLLLGETKAIVVGNEKGQYTLTCLTKHVGGQKIDDATLHCVNPKPDTDYWVFDNQTQWTMPGASKTANLQFFKDFSVEYSGDNIALVPVDMKTDWGIYALRSWKKN